MRAERTPTKKTPERLGRASTNAIDYQQLQLAAELDGKSYPEQLSVVEPPRPASRISVQRKSSAGAKSKENPVQASSEGGASGATAVKAAAVEGIKGSGGTLPYFDRIQQSFGAHDLTAVQAHTDANASRASKAMGARAYTMGERVAFTGAPDLHTAAHEAAHVVQQRQGVSLPGGVGRVGDAYEKHADAVADRVVGGRSATDLLGGGGASASQATVQQSPAPESAVQLQVVQLTGEPPASPPQDSSGGGNTEAKAKADEAWADLQAKIKTASDSAGVAAAMEAAKKAEAALKAASDVTRELEAGSIYRSMERIQRYVDEVPQKAKEVYEKAYSPSFFPGDSMIEDESKKITGLVKVVEIIKQVKADWEVYQRIKSTLSDIRTKQPDGLPPAQSGLLTDINGESFKRFGAAGTQALGEWLTDLAKEAAYKAGSATSYPEIDKIKEKCDEARKFIDTFESFASALGVPTPVEQAKKTRITDLETLNTEWLQFKARVGEPALQAATIDQLNALHPEIKTWEDRFRAASVYTSMVFLNMPKSISGALAPKLYDELKKELQVVPPGLATADLATQELYDKTWKLSSDAASKARDASIELKLDEEDKRIREINWCLKVNKDWAQTPALEKLLTEVEAYVKANEVFNTSLQTAKQDAAGKLSQLWTGLKALGSCIANVFKGKDKVTEAERQQIKLEIINGAQALTSFLSTGGLAEGLLETALDAIPDNVKEGSAVADALLSTEAERAVGQNTNLVKGGQAVQYTGNLFKVLFSEVDTVVASLLGIPIDPLQGAIAVGKALQKKGEGYTVAEAVLFALAEYFAGGSMVEKIPIIGPFLKATGTIQAVADAMGSFLAIQEIEVTEQSLTKDDEKLTDYYKKLEKLASRWTEERFKSPETFNTRFDETEKRKEELGNKKKLVELRRTLAKS